MQNSNFDLRLSSLKKILKDQKIDFFILPNSDEFFSEYLPESQKRIQYVTAFSGSAATVIIGEKKSYFFTDGRYVLQAKNELNPNEFSIFNIAEKSVLTWLAENIYSEKTLALDPKLSNINFVKTCEKLPGNLIFVDANPVDKIWENHSNLNNSAIFFCEKNLTGADSITKRNKILPSIDADAVIISKPENIAWLLNIRAADIEYVPLLLAYAILYKNGEIDLFVDEKRISNLGHADLSGVNFIQPNCFDLRISILSKSMKKIQIDTSAANYWLYELLQKYNFEIISKIDAIEIAKACKNDAEIKSAIKAHEVDGLAVTKFLSWLDISLKNGAEIDEISAAEKLLNFRKEHADFLYPSFASISSFASNGAIIHYHANHKTNKKITGDSLYLIDSGGQYFGAEFFGTTDVTRTIAIGNPTAEMIENFTRVLKGHISLARAKFPVGTSGAQLDVLARSHLWQAQKDYDHGTGHGVGSFLSVHEGPCGISKRAHQPLLPGMILSNEPGYYLEGGYGIRIESLMLVEEYDVKFLRFKTLTMAPIDPNLIDFKMMTYPEKTWLRDYHEKLVQSFSDKLEHENMLWLKAVLEVFEERCNIPN